MTKQVLIVDDAAFMRMMLKDILVKGGYEIVGESSNGKDALEAFDKLHPDLVTMDITMPEMDGIEAVKQLMKSHPEAKVVMVSAMGQEKLIVEAMEAGANDFIVKPFQPAKILETVMKTLNNN
jgi:two-component system chemotaxis response regulator CheY